MDLRRQFAELHRFCVITQRITRQILLTFLADDHAPVLDAARSIFPQRQQLDAFASIIAKRWIVVRMHATYVALTGAFGATAILHASGVLLHNDSLLIGVFAASLFLVAMSISLQLLASRGSVGGRLSTKLSKWKRVAAWVESRRHHFAHADTQLAKWLSFTGGLRADSNSLFEDRLSPRAALFVNRGDRYGLKLLYAQGFRNPSPYEGYFQDGISFEENPDLRAETITSYEAVGWARAGGVSARVSALDWDAEKIVDTWLNTPFEGGRHVPRVEKIELQEGAE